jgi:hypothetical protein
LRVYFFQEGMCFMNARRLTLKVAAALCALAGALLLSSAPALAAAPEAPTVTVGSPVRATEATVYGILDPGLVGGPGSYETGAYQFLYKKGAASCEGEGAAPASPGLSLGAGHEELPAETLTGLTANTEYTVCLRIETAGGTTVGPAVPVHFTTAIQPETPETLKAEPVTATSETLHGVLNPKAIGNPGSYEFLYKASATDCEGGETSGGSATGTMAEKVEAKLTGLLPNTTYAFCLRAHNEAGEESALAGPVTFTTLPEPPAVTGESSSGVESAEATVSAWIDPEGQASAYHVEYGTSEAYGQSTTEKSLPGAGFTPLKVQARLTGLQAGATYHYRFVATNALHETMRAEDGVFTTRAAPPASGSEHCENEAARTGPSATLPDCRAYEQVTPANKSGTVTEPNKNSDAVVAAEDGERLALRSLAAFGPVPQENGAFSVFSRTSSEWKIASVKPAGTGDAVYEPQILSPNLTQVGAEVTTEVPFSPDRTYQVGVPGGPFATVAETPRKEHIYNELEGGSSNLSRVVLGTIDHTLLSATPTGTDERAYDLYEWSGGGACGSVTSNCKLVNEKEGHLIGKCGATLGDEGVMFSQGGIYNGQESHNAVSADGSKVFFTAPDPRAGGEEGCSNGHQPGPNALRLYMRAGETVAGREVSRTVEVAEPNEGVHLSPTEEEEIPVFYQAATVDGSKVFFLTARALTSEATVGEAHLYEYDTEAAAGHRVKLIFRGSELAGDENLPEGWVYPSRDGSVVYFYTNGGGTLYRYEVGAGPPQLIASVAFPRSFEAPYSTPDGQFFEFESQGVTVEGRSETRGAGHNEFYRYDHADGSVMCVSCGPGIAPGGDATEREQSFFHDQTPQLIPMSEDGSEDFFQSTAALVPQVVTEGVMNVYEWEAAGAGACTQSLGCTYLISQGNSPYNSELIGASRNGSNVFFLTHAQLVPQDTDSFIDIYDARVDGGFPAPAQSAACLGDTCLSVPPALNDPTPASLSFSGPGNPAPLPATVKPKPKPKVKKCGKGRVRKKGRCVKRPKAKRAAWRAARHNRGGSK